jgi:PBSX family phage terminase large subunit
MTYQNKKIIKLSDLIIPKYHSTFNDTKYMHKIFTSGRAGTKSSRGALRAVQKIIEDDNCSVVIMRKFHNKLKKTVYKECLRAINRLGLSKKDFKITVSPMEIKYLNNGNTIYFTGNDSIDDTKGMIDENKPIKLVELDELTEFFDKGEGEDEITNIEATFVRGNDDEFCMEYYFNPPQNPKAPIMQWVEKMVQRPDCIRIHTDYRDVPVSWLGKKLIQTAELLKKLDEKMYNWIWLGLCTGIDEVIYYMFNEEEHIKEVTEEELKKIPWLYVGVDYGQMNATTYQCFGLDYKNKCVRGIDEYYHSGRESGKQRSPSEYAKDFKDFKDRIEKETSKRIKFVFIDPSAKGLAEEIKRLCPDISIKNANNKVLLGINRVQKLMSFRRLFLSPKQKHLIEERYQYKWNEDLLDKGKEEPVKVNDHCSDGERYATMGVWKYIRQLLPFIDVEEKK